MCIYVKYKIKSNIFYLINLNYTDLIYIYTLIINNTLLIKRIYIYPNNYYVYKFKLYLLKSIKLIKYIL